MSEQPERFTSELFTLRLWNEPLGRGQSEWRGEIKNLASGETRYFRYWDEVVDLLREMLPNSADGEGEANQLVD